MKTTFRPIGDHVVIKRDKAESKTPGGIVLPEVAQDRPKKGTVIAVGPGTIDTGLRISPQVKPGDRVVFAAFGGGAVELNGEKYVVIREVEILSILETEA